MDASEIMGRPVALVNWTDSKGLTGEWEHLDDLAPMPPCECQTVGFVMEENKDYITVAMTRSAGQVLGRMTIPTCSIVSVHRNSDLETPSRHDPNRMFRYHESVYLEGFKRHKDDCGGGSVLTKKIDEMRVWGADGETVMVRTDRVRFDEYGPSTIFVLKESPESPHLTPTPDELP